jgi:flavin-dependent dehydrogenase
VSRRWVTVSRCNAQVDVLVVGGGPAGVVTAWCLRRLGYAVAIVAPPTGPGMRCHEYETLSPLAQHHLESLGMGDVVARARVTATEFEAAWEGSRLEQRAPVGLVSSCTFRESLQALAREAGVPIWNGRIRSWRRCRGTSYAIIVSGSGGYRTIRAHRLVEATGRSGWRGRQTRRDSGLVALQARWCGKRMPQTVRLSAAPCGWVWGAPGPDGHYVTLAFEDPRDGRRLGKSVQRRIFDLIGESGIMHDVGDATLDGVGAFDATPQLRRPIGTTGVVRVGDAALSIDPISSSGIQSAIQSAVDAASAIHTLDQRPAARACVVRFLESRLTSRHARHGAWTAATYRQGVGRFQTPFWITRAGRDLPESFAETVGNSGVLPATDQRVRLHPGVRVEPEPCLVDDSIELRLAVYPAEGADSVVFIDGVEVGAMLAKIRPATAAKEVVSDWSAKVGVATAVKIMSWAWRKQLLVAHDGA